MALLSLRGRTRETASGFTAIFRKGILWPKSYRTSQGNRFWSDHIHRLCSRRDWSGKYYGYNTDGYGLSKGIEEDLSASLAGSDIAILGAGGAARAAAVQALQSDCQSLCIVNRSADRLENLLGSLQPVAREKGIPVKGFSAQDTSLEFADHTLIINATSLGLNSSDPLPIPEDRLPQTAALYDMIYNPRTTKLMKTVSDRGGRSANGLSMLVYQGLRALEIWSDRKIDPRNMKQAASSALASKA